MLPLAVRMTRVPTMTMSTSPKMRKMSRVVFTILGRDYERMNEREDNADEESGEVLPFQVD